ncbi:MAG: LlsX family protein [Oscillospiraceae bacterium]|jgi:hypothetical protein
MRQHLKKHMLVRFILEFVGGNIISAVLCSILIFIGYYHAHSANLTAYTVRLFQLPIYDITTTGGEMSGTAINQNMGIMGIICAVLCIIVCETIHFVKKKS